MKAQHVVVGKILNLEMSPQRSSSQWCCWKTRKNLSLSLEEGAALLKQLEAEIHGFRNKQSPRLETHA